MNGFGSLRIKQVSNEEENGQIRKFRKQIAEAWLNTPDNKLPEAYHGDLGTTHRKMLSPDFKSAPLCAEETAFARDLTAGFKSYEKGFSGLQRFIALMLYLRPYQMPVQPNVQRLPTWLQEDYFAFLLENPLCFWEVGETEQYFCHINRVLTHLHNAINTEPNSAFWKRMALIFLQKANLIPLYFCRDSLRDFFEMRGDVVAFALKSAGFHLDYAFPPRPTNRTRIRLGIHIKKWTPYSEVFASLPVFTYLDRNKFELFLYVNSSDGNPTEQYVRSLADKFTLLPDDMKLCISPFRDDDLDVLFFCNNSTAVLSHSLILGSHRLARQQFVHFCNPGTTGLRNMDYFAIGSFIQNRDGRNTHFSEKLIEMNGSGICFEVPDRPKTKEHKTERKDLGIPEGSILFASGANFFKIIPELRLIWARIIASNSAFVLVLYPFGPAWSSKYPSGPFVTEMKGIFQQHGIESSNLIILNPFQNQDDIKSFLSIADVYLDALPYSGATSLIDPLTMGVPPVVMEGTELRFCQGAAMLKEMGMNDLIAGNEEEYMKIALRLAADADFRRNQSDEILKKMRKGPPFLDSRSYGKQMEKALGHIVEGKGWQ